MSQGILGVMTAEILPGKVQELRSVCEKLSRVTEENEPGALEYEWWVHDEKTLHIFERYADSDAVINHLKNVGELLGELGACTRTTGMFIYGTPSDALREALQPGPTYLTKIGGFSR